MSDQVSTVFPSLRATDEQQTGDGRDFGRGKVPSVHYRNLLKSNSTHLLLPTAQGTFRDLRPLETRLGDLAWFQENSWQDGRFLYSSLNCRPNLWTELQLASDPRLHDGFCLFFRWDNEQHSDPDQSEEDHIVETAWNPCMEVSTDWMSMVAECARLCHAAKAITSLCFEGFRTANNRNTPRVTRNVMNIGSHSLSCISISHLLCHNSVHNG